MVKKSRKYLENIFLSVTYGNYVSVLGDIEFVLVEDFVAWFC